MFPYKTLLFIFSLPFILRAHNLGDELKCGFNSDDFKPEFLDIEEDRSFPTEGRILQLEEYPKIRLYGVYDYLEDSAPTEYVDYVKNELVPPVFSYFSNALRLRYPVSGKLILKESTICKMKTPSVLKTGVDADYALILTSKYENSNVVANSKYCFLTTGTNRPIVASTSLNRYKIQEAKGNVLLHEKNTYVLIHEMMHTLGISDSMFNFYIDLKGKTLKNHIKTVTIASQKRTVIDIAPLTQKLQNYYGCPNVPGLIMENDGGSGNAGSHLERKFFVYETMSSGSINGRRVSEFSLALLEASGWYVADYSFAEPFFFGQGQGCDFIFGKCSSSTNFDEFCTGSSRGCAAHGRSGGLCSSDSKTEGCKYVDPDTNNDCENDFGAFSARFPELEVYGRSAGSKCFTGDLDTETTPSATSFCFKYTCSGNGSSTQLEVKVGADTVVCKEAGKQSISGYYGSINCPDPLTFCRTTGKKYCPRNCMGRGTCVDNECQCEPGFKGIDCGLKE